MLYFGSRIKPELKLNFLFNPVCLEKTDISEISKTGWERSAGVISPVKQTPSCPYGLLTFLSVVLCLKNSTAWFYYNGQFKQTEAQARKNISLSSFIFFFFKLILLFIQTLTKKILARVFLISFFGCTCIPVHACAHTRTNVCIFTVVRKNVQMCRCTVGNIWQMSLGRT